MELGGQLKGWCETVKILGILWVLTPTEEGKVGLKSQMGEKGNGKALGYSATSELAQRLLHDFETARPLSQLGIDKG